MSESLVNNWFKELERIWQEKDVLALRGIMADVFKYYEDPFEPPITSLSKLEEVWQEVKDQNIETLEIVTLIDGGRVGLAKYDLCFTDKLGLQHKSKGAYYLELNYEGRATEFRQWWATEGP